MNNARVSVKDAGPAVDLKAVIAPDLPLDLVVVAGLHDLVPLPEDHVLPLHLSLVLRRRIEDALQHLVEPDDSQRALPHGRQHLDLAHIAVEIPRQFVPHKLHRVLVDDRRAVPLQKEEIAALVAHLRHLAVEDPVSVGDDVALHSLPEDLAQHDRPECAGGDQILQHFARADAGQLVHISHQDQPRSRHDSFEE